MNFQDLQPCGDLILQLKPMVLRVTHFPLNTEAGWQTLKHHPRHNQKHDEVGEAAWSLVEGSSTTTCRIKTSNKSSLNHDPAIVAAEWSLITKKNSPTKKKVFGKILPSSVNYASPMVQTKPWDTEPERPSKQEMVSKSSMFHLFLWGFDSFGKLTAIAANGFSKLSVGPPASSNSEAFGQYIFEGLHWK